MVLKCKNNMYVYRPFRYHIESIEDGVLHIKLRMLELILPMNVADQYSSRDWNPQPFSCSLNVFTQYTNQPSHLYRYLMYFNMC